METVHTQSPWEVIRPEKAPGYLLVKIGNDFFYLAPSTAETEANAKIIAAAPENFEANNNWLSFFTDIDANMQIESAKQRLLQLCPELKLYLEKSKAAVNKSI